MARILSVEDEADLQADIVEELIDAGHEVVTATTGQEALEAVVGHAPDLIICDSLMPVMTGLEFFTRLRAEHPEMNDIPFVFLSAHADRTHVEDGLERGADAYLTKPVDFAEMLKTVEALLEGKNPPRDAASQRSSAAPPPTAQN
jgi:CheY-like chemotaxis protein